MGGDARGGNVFLALEVREMEWYGRGGNVFLTLYVREMGWYGRCGELIPASDDR